MKKASMSTQKDMPIQPDLFVCKVLDVANWPIKDDLASMDVPIFSLSRHGDTEVRKYTRGNRSITVTPSVLGAATVFDKDLLLFVASQIIAARNKGKPVSRKVKVDSYDYLTATERSDGGKSFDGVIGTLRRLRGTGLETNIETNGIRQIDGFGLIEDYSVLVEKKRNVTTIDKRTGKKSLEQISRVLSFEITLSEWLMNGLLNYEVLTLDHGYFKLDSAIDRRLYEIARRHSGDKAIWKINIDSLAEKLGTTRERFKLRSDLRETIKNKSLPEYYMALDTKTTPDDVVFFTRDTAKLSKHLIDTNQIKWFESLERE